MRGSARLPSADLALPTTAHQERFSGSASEAPTSYLQVASSKQLKITAIIIILMIQRTARTVHSLLDGDGYKLLTHSTPTRALREQNCYQCSGGGHWGAERAAGFSGEGAEQAPRPHRLALVSAPPPDLAGSGRPVGSVETTASAKFLVGVDSWSTKTQGQRPGLYPRLVSCQLTSLLCFLVRRDYRPKSTSASPPQSQAGSGTFLKMFLRRDIPSPSPHQPSQDARMCTLK